MIHWVHLRGGGGSESVKRYVMQASYRIQNTALHELSNVQAAWRELLSTFSASLSSCV